MKSLQKNLKKKKEKKNWPVFKYNLSSPELINGN